MPVPFILQIFDFATFSFGCHFENGFGFKIAHDFAVTSCMTVFLSNMSKQRGQPILPSPSMSGSASPTVVIRLHSGHFNLTSRILITISPAYMNCYVDTTEDLDTTQPTEDQIEKVASALESNTWHLANCLHPEP